MKYTVTWKPWLKPRLAQVWLDSDDRQAVTTAADAIDALLRTDPLGQGESRSDNTRIIIVPPLAAVYEVFEDDRRVEILSIRDISHKK